MAGVYRGMVDDAKVLLNNSGADLWVVQKDTLGPYAEPSSIHDDVYRGILGMPGVAQAANVTYLTMQVAQGRHRRTRDGRGLRRRRARRTGLPDRGPSRDPQSLRSGGRRECGVRRGRSHPHPSPRVHRRRPDPAHGVVRRRSDGVHPAQGRTGSAVPQGQRRHRQRACPHRRQPDAQSSGVPGLLEAIEASQTSNHNVNAVLVRVAEGRSPEVVAQAIRRWKHRAGLHPRADGRHPDREADRHRVEADRHVPGDSDHRQRGHRGVHHLHHDAGQDQGDRRAEADRHAQPHHCQHDPATGPGAGPHRVRRRQDRRNALGAGASHDTSCSNLETLSAAS